MVCFTDFTTRKVLSEVLSEMLLACQTAMFADAAQSRFNVEATSVFIPPSVLSIILHPRKAFSFLAWIHHFGYTHFLVLCILIWPLSIFHSGHLMGIWLSHRPAIWTAKRQIPDRLGTRLKTHHSAAFPLLRLMPSPEDGTHAEAVPTPFGFDKLRSEGVKVFAGFLRRWLPGAE